ncbi:hypothetical protein, partial [Thermaurantimonas aggregans]|uniref:hypothetical protein n=1 Tax=Thermaurantimonas aggregans TaxID=2173829 RepID=UPI001C3F56BB
KKCPSFLLKLRLLKAAEGCCRVRCLEGDGEAGSAQRSEAPSEERARKGSTPGEGAESTVPGGTPK